MIHAVDPVLWLALRYTPCHTEGMNSLDQARAVIAAVNAKRVAKHPYTGQILVSPTSTHLLARRAEGGVWA